MTERNSSLKTVEWKNDKVVMIDQTKLPNELVYVEYSDYHDVANAIKTLIVRGAPAIGVSGAFGLQGWVKIRPYSMNADALLDAPLYWLELPSGKGTQEVKRLSSKIHGEDVVARLSDVPDRTAAEALKGSVVKISRALFPVLPEGEFYWVDLLDLSVENLQGEQLGVVRGMMDNGAQSILRVK